MKSVTIIYKNHVRKYGLGPIAVDVAHEAAVLRASSARCAPNTVPSVSGLEWITFADIASSHQLSEALANAGVQRSHASGFCVGFEVDSVPQSLDEVILCDASRRSVRTALGMTVPAGPHPVLKSDCVCTACKHKLTTVREVSGERWSSFSAPGPCTVAEFQSVDASKVLTIILPTNQSVCGTVLTMTRVPGITAAKAVRGNPDQAVRVCKSVLNALARLHCGDVVHNDCKLDNFVIDLDTMLTQCVDLEMATTPTLPACHLLGVVASAAGIELQWSKEGQKCDVTQVCVAFHEMCGSLSPGFCSAIATFAKPFEVKGHLGTPIYFRRCAGSGFVTASVAETAVRLHAENACVIGGSPLRADC